MSTQQKRAELLTFGYIKTTYKGTVPSQIIRLIQLFYDIYFYWILKSDQLSKTSIVCLKSFNIKGIEFRLEARIQSHRNWCNTRIPAHPLVHIGLKIEHIPKEIDYFVFYYEIECEVSNYVTKQIQQVQQNDVGKLFDDSFIYPLSELQDIEKIYLNCMVNIKCIKYRRYYSSESLFASYYQNGIDYYSPANKMQKYFKYTWNIDEKLFQKCKTALVTQPMYSDTFDNNNWCLQMFPNGDGASYAGTDIYLKCLSIPHKIHSMDVKIKFVVNDSEKTKERTMNITLGNLWSGHHVMHFTDFKEKQQLSFVVSLEVISLHINRISRKLEMWTIGKIAENEWEKFGIINHQ